MDNHKHAYKPQRTTNYVSLVLLSINVKFAKSRYILTVHESRCCQQWAEWSRRRWKNLPKSLFAIISSWVSSRPRFVAERNCQLNISPNWGQVAAGVLAKNITSWEKQTYAHHMYTINLVLYYKGTWMQKHSMSASNSDLSPWDPDWACWTRGQMPRHFAAGWSLRWWPQGGWRPTSVCAIKTYSFYLGHSSVTKAAN